MERVYCIHDVGKCMANSINKLCHNYVKHFRHLSLLYDQTLLK